MTIVGGMLQLGGGLLPGTVPQLLATGAVGLSAVNLAGGFIVTHKVRRSLTRLLETQDCFVVPRCWKCFGVPQIHLSTGTTSCCRLGPPSVGTLCFRWRV